MLSLTTAGCTGVAKSQEINSKDSRETRVTESEAKPGDSLGHTDPQPGDAEPQVTTPKETKPPQTSPPNTKPPIVRSQAERLVEEWEGRIYPGIKISGFNVGGLTYKAAEEKMEKAREKALARKIRFSSGDKNYSLTQKELGVRFNYDAALTEAKEAYQDLNTSEKVRILETEPELNLTLKKSIDEEKISDLIKKVGDETYRKPTLEQTGRRVYTITMKNDLLDRIRFSTKDSDSFNVSLEIKAKLAPVKPDPPSGSENSERGTIASGSSKFAESNKNRSFNVKRGAARLDGVVIKPGETFSFNKTVGSASKKNGYLLAGVYSGDTLDEGYGGGICQVSSTLYNAVIRAGLQLVERHTHGFTVSYLPKGMDATIYYGSLDLKFKNTLSVPVTIRTSADSGKLKIRFVADKSAMDGISYEFSRKLLWEGEEHWTTTYTSDLAPGDSEVVYSPHPAAEVNVYRTTLKNGKEIKTEYFDNVTYRSLKGLLLKGQE